jgi:hypothetical protein
LLASSRAYLRYPHEDIHTFLTAFQLFTQITVNPALPAGYGYIWAEKFRLALAVVRPEFAGDLDSPGQRHFYALLLNVQSHRRPRLFFSFLEQMASAMALGPASWGDAFTEAAEAFDKLLNNQWDSGYPEQLMHLSTVGLINNMNAFLANHPLFWISQVPPGVQGALIAPSEPFVLPPLHETIPEDAFLPPDLARF